MTCLPKAVAFFIFILICSLAGCAPETRYEVLSFFFDGVPKPGAEKPRDREGRRPSAERPTAKEPGAPGMKFEGPVEQKESGVKVAKVESPVPQSSEAPRPPIERLRTWEEVLKALPKDVVGGADWVKAIKEGVIAPRPHPDPGIRPQLPFTLDTLVPAIASNGKPPLHLDIELVPRDAPFFKVLFPHSSHTVWLNCSSCHPGIGAKRAGMAEIFAGKYCGGCHGKVAFDPKTGCPRCHVHLVPAGEDVVEADLARARDSPVPMTPQLLKRGGDFYLQACTVCHGERGDGKGPLAAVLEPKPRDFTAGKLKFRSTSSSSLPTDFDLFRTITRGIFGTSMPSFSGLPYEDRWALVHFIKTFSERFANEQPTQPIPIHEPPPRTSDLLQMGKQLYVEAGCNECHGDTGRGDGPSAPDLKDDWGQPIRPFDFTRGSCPKAGCAARDIYRAVMTGLQGTPMPDYGDAFEPEQAWGVVYYVRSLGEQKRERGFGVQGDIAFPRRPKEGEVPPATFAHWFHRIRFRCATCHPGIFRMKAGANPITMDAMREGKFCSRCHNGKIAWQAAFDTCVRCHGAR